MKNKTRNIILVLLLVSLVAAGLILAPSFGKQGLISKKLISKEMKNNKNLSTVRPDEANPAPTINIPNLNPPGLNPPGPAVALPACPQAGQLPVYNSAREGSVSTFPNINYNGFYNAFKAEVLAGGGETECPYLFEMRDADSRTVYSILCQRFDIYDNNTAMTCYASSSNLGVGRLVIGQNELLVNIDMIYDNLKVLRIHGPLDGNSEVFKVSPDFRL